MQNPPNIVTTSDVHKDRDVATTSPARKTGFEVDFLQWNSWCCRS
jgi:hypothetical protein